MNTQEHYLERLETRMKKWKADLDQVKAKAAQSGSKAQSEYYRLVEKATEKEEEARRKFAELKEAGQESWDDLKVGFERTADELQDALEKSLENFSAGKH